MELAIKALTMSSPNTDALHRWKDERWIAQRREAIQALDDQLCQPKNQALMDTTDHLAQEAFWKYQRSGIGRGEGWNAPPAKWEDQSKEVQDCWLFAAMSSATRQISDITAAAIKLLAEVQKSS